MTTDKQCCDKCLYIRTKGGNPWSDECINTDCPCHAQEEATDKQCFPHNFMEPGGNCTECGVSSITHTAQEEAKEVRCAVCKGPLLSHHKRNKWQGYILHTACYGNAKKMESFLRSEIAQARREEREEILLAHDDMLCGLCKRLCVKCGYERWKCEDEGYINSCAALKSQDHE